MKEEGSSFNPHRSSFPILIACCGNALAGDDAFGPLVAQDLLKGPPPEAEIVNLAMNPASLLDHLEGRRVLIVVDAAQVPGSEGGELIECDWRDPARPRLLSESAVSTHGFSMSDQLELANRLGLLPPVVRIMAVTIDTARMFTQANAGTKRQAVQAADRVREMVGVLFFATPLTPGVRHGAHSHAPLGLAEAPSIESRTSSRASMRTERFG